MDSIDQIKLGEQIARATLASPTKPTPAPDAGPSPGDDPAAAQARATVPAGAFKRPAGI